MPAARVSDALVQGLRRVHRWFPPLLLGGRGRTEAAVLGSLSSPSPMGEEVAKPPPGVGARNGLGLGAAQVV